LVVYAIFSGSAILAQGQSHLVDQLTGGRISSTLIGWLHIQVATKTQICEHFQILVGAVKKPSKIDCYVDFNWSMNKFFL
jgi:hypothetical protein